MRPTTVKENDILTFIPHIERPGPKRRIISWLRNGRYSWLVNHSRPQRDEKRKYHISICTIFKDEAPYLKEWIEYHLLVGVDHFYLYDNNSSDGFESVIGSYVEEGRVTLVRWPEEHAQMKGFEDCISRFQGESDWIGFIDVDEFVVPVEEESLVSFLDRHSRYGSIRVL